MIGTSIYVGDCLEGMDNFIQKGIKVDAVITDLPYGRTGCSWDATIPFDAMWERIHKIAKDNAPVILFGLEPFSSKLRLSNLTEYKYDWKWVKPNATTPNLAKKQPMRRYEDIMVFHTTKYYPQMREGKPYNWNSKRSGGNASGIQYKEDKPIVNTGTRYPTNILEFGQERGYHPTQKPVPLMEYLINTYTLPGESVLDFTMGSGSTGVACIRTRRYFYGIENNEKYIEIAEERFRNEVESVCPDGISRV